MNYHAQHLFFRSGFACPDLELPGTLVNEHLHACDHGNTFLPRHANERRLKRVVDQVEDQPRVNLIGLEEARRLDSMHTGWSGVDDDVEAALGQLLTLKGLGLGLTREFLCGFGGAVQHEYFRALVLQPEDRCARRASRAHDEDLGAFQLQAPLKWADDGSNVGIEAVELALL